MDANHIQNAKTDQALCPFLRQAQAEWIYPVRGFCRGLPRGLLMIPSVEEYRTRCTTEAYPACPVYRSRTGGNGEELGGWLGAQYHKWGLRLGPILEPDETGVQGRTAAGSRPQPSRIPARRESGGAAPRPPKRF